MIRNCKRSDRQDIYHPCSWTLRGMDARLKEIPLSELCCLPSTRDLLKKERTLLPIGEQSSFLRKHPFSEGIMCAGKQTRSQ